MANAMKQTLSRVQTIVEREKQQRDRNFHKVLHLKGLSHETDFKNFD